MALVMGLDSSFAVDGSMICNGGIEVVMTADGALCSLEIVWKSWRDVVAG